MSNLKKWYWVLNDISKRNAGLNIRTYPIIEQLQTSFLKVTLISSDEIYQLVMKRQLPVDAKGFIFSKPSHSQALLLITFLRQKGFPVVLDLFDNYFAFSKWSCQRGLPWIWLQVLYLADAVIISTPVLENWVERLRPDIATVSVCDPLPWRNKNLINYTEKWSQLTNKRRLLWFGIGSNPYYRAGLIDLIDWLPKIEKLYAEKPNGIEIELVICSNNVPEAKQAILCYRQVGIPVRFVLWTKEVCDAELKKAHCVLIPTGSSEFIRAKTHNRLSDSINNSCLVFTTKYSPYENFIGDAIQTDLEKIEKLLFNESYENIRLSFEKTLVRLTERHPFENQIDILAIQLEKTQIAVKKRNQSQGSRYKMLIMACKTTGSTVKLARKVDYLVVGYQKNYVGVTYDIFLQDVDVTEQSLILHCSEAGENALTSLGLELVSTEENLFLVILPSKLSKILQELKLCLSIDSLHDEINARVSNLSVQLLLYLFNNQQVDVFLADDMGFCTADFVTHYAKSLIKPAQTLETMWEELHNDDNTQHIFTKRIFPRLN